MLILASASPRRRELLSQIGVAYMVNPSTYEEDVPKKKDPAKFVLARHWAKPMMYRQNIRASGYWVPIRSWPSMVKSWASRNMKKDAIRMLQELSDRNIPYLRGWHWYGVKRLTRKWWKPRSGSGS